MSWDKAPKEVHYERAAAIYPDPRILYEPDPDSPESFFDQIKAPLSGAILIGGVPVGDNMMRRRPLYSGIHITIMAAIGGAVAFHYIRKGIVSYYIRRDQMYRHYIQTHPEDFPNPPKQLMADQWRPWHPRR